MDEGPAEPAILAPARSGRRRWPFWALQVTEIAIALVFVDISIHVDSGGLLIGAAVLFMILAATADGPLGIARVCSPRLHVILVVVAAVVIGLAPLIPAVRPDIQGIIVVEFGAVGLIRLATLTNLGDAAEGVRVGMPSRSSVIDATATVSTASEPSASTPSSDPGTGDASGSRRTAHPDSSPADDAARWAGRTAAAAAASGREAAAKYRPEAEAHVKRTIKEAGRLAGKLASRWNPPEDRPR
jgi:hypothetical protein